VAKLRACLKGHGMAKPARGPTASMGQRGHGPIMAMFATCTQVCHPSYTSLAPGQCQDARVSVRRQPCSSHTCLLAGIIHCSCQAVCIGKKGGCVQTQRNTCCASQRGNVHHNLSYK
jgi:hypothetical protein